VDFAFLVVVVGGAVFSAQWLRARSEDAPAVATASVSVPVQPRGEAMERAIADRRRRRDAA